MKHYALPAGQLPAPFRAFWIALAFGAGLMIGGVAGGYLGLMQTRAWGEALRYVCANESDSYVMALVPMNDPGDGPGIEESRCITADEAAELGIPSP
jgi:hypothetical protein